jgi:hypothetical protein
MTSCSHSQIAQQSTSNITKLDQQAYGEMQMGQKDLSLDNDFYCAFAKWGFGSMPSSPASLPDLEHKESTASIDTTRQSKSENVHRQ